MFHELWVGINRNEDLKVKLWGKMQLKLILSLMSNLKPFIIHTQTALYQSMLLNYGFHARLLPLFSNIPLAITRPNQFPTKPEFKNREIISLILFGSIHKNVPVQQFASELKNYSKKISKDFKLTILGRSGKEAERWSDEFRKQKMEAISVGEQTDSNISKFFQDADFGITTSDFDIIEKSGSVAGMIEHGLNVICVSRESDKDRNLNSKRIKGLYYYTEGNLEEFFNSEPDPTLKTFFSSVRETSLNLIGAFNDFHEVT
jgi:hypothetical protein